MIPFNPKVFEDHESLTEKVEEYLESLILKGVLPPRERLVGSMLASRLKITRGPIREAFRILERDGLVATIPRKGTFVAGITS
jgi:DNA-binding GntR family transcriptional regulator